MYRKLLGVSRNRFPRSRLDLTKERSNLESDYKYLAYDFTYVREELIMPIPRMSVFRRPAHRMDWAIKEVLDDQSIAENASGHKFCWCLKQHCILARHHSSTAGTTLQASLLDELPELFADLWSPWEFLTVSLELENLSVTPQTWPTL